MNVELRKGQSIYFVKDVELAACLLAVGVPLRTDPPAVHVKTADGKAQWTFHFEEATSDGRMKTIQLIKAYLQDMEFLDKNPQHPFAFAMAAVKNKNRLMDAMKKHLPMVGFRASSDPDSAVIYVQENSQRYHRCVSKGLTKI